MIAGVCFGHRIAIYGSERPLWVTAAHPVSCGNRQQWVEPARSGVRTARPESGASSSSKRVPADRSRHRMCERYYAGEARGYSPERPPSPWRGSRDGQVAPGCQTTSGIDRLATRRIDPPGWLLTIEAALAEGVVHGVDRGNPRRERAPSIARRATARGYLWAPVGELRSRCGKPQSVSPKAARRLDAGQFVEIEIKDGLQRLTGGAVA